MKIGSVVLPYPIVILWGVSLLWFFRKYRTATAERVSIKKEDVLYKESFASGHSNANFFTKMGGASNCLRLIVTKDLLRVTSWFPFSLFTPALDLEHTIQLKQILPSEQGSFLGMKSLLLRFPDRNGLEHELVIYPKDFDGFLRAITAAPKGK